MNKQAILIMAHNNLWILKNLIKTLDSEYFDIFVHIDLKSNIDKTCIDKICHKSKLFVYKKIDIRWAHYSQIECELLLLKNALNFNNYSYYHLISGVDFPIKKNSELYNYFEKSDKEFIHYESRNLPSKKNSYYHKYNLNMKNYRKNVFHKVINKIGLLIQNLFFLKTNKNMEFYTGANWFSISQDCAKYIVSKENKIEKIYKYSRSGDESFLQTIAFNSQFKNKLYNKNFNNDYNSIKRFIDWKKGKPYIFKAEDYDELINSSCYFARKFDEKVDKQIIEKIIEYREK